MWVKVERKDWNNLVVVLCFDNVLYTLRNRQNGTCCEKFDLLPHVDFGKGGMMSANRKLLEVVYVN